MTTTETKAPSVSRQPISLLGLSIIERMKEVCSEIASLPEDEAIAVLNAVRMNLHVISPMREEPVDCVVWVKSEEVQANAYNPNSADPSKMRLLKHSIKKNGFAMGIVAWPTDGHYEIVDGFHRSRVGKEDKAVKKRLRGYLPLSFLKPDRYELPDRMAATVEFNRARGEHQIEGMSKIVMELKRRNWSDEKIGKELGMEPDEVLRMAQITGLAEMFADREFSEAWEVEYD